MISCLPDALLQLIWEFIPMRDSVSFSMCTKNLNTILSREITAIRRMRNLLCIDGVNLSTNLHMVGSARSAQELSFHSTTNLKNKKFYSLTFLNKCMNLKQLSLIQTMSPKTLAKIFRAFSHKNVDSIVLKSQFHHINTDKLNILENMYDRRWAFNELSTIQTAHIYLEEKYIDQPMLQLFFESIKKIRKLKSVHLHDTYISDKCMHEFSKATMLNEIRATCCHMQSHQICTIEPLLRNITSLDLSYNNIERKGINTLFELFSLRPQILKKMILECTFDYDLILNPFDDIFNVNTFASFCKSQSNLVSLNMSGNRLNNQFIFDCKNSIEELCKLENLEIGNNLICQNGLHKLSRISNKLITLDLNGNYIEEMKLTRFSDRLFNSIRKLNMGSIPVNNKCLQDMANHAHNKCAFQRLVHISMIGCNLVDSNIYSIMGIIKSFQKLLIIDLEENDLTNYAHTYFCEELATIKNRHICMVLSDNCVDNPGNVPSPHIIIC